MQALQRDPVGFPLAYKKQPISFSTPQRVHCFVAIVHLVREWRLGGRVALARGPIPVYFSHFGTETQVVLMLFPDFSVNNGESKVIP